MTISKLCRVYGVRNLRVADASIMPVIISGPTMAAAIVIGEKASDLIKLSHGISASSTKSKKSWSRITSSLKAYILSGSGSKILAMKRSHLYEPLINMVTHYVYCIHNIVNTLTPLGNAKIWTFSTAEPCVALVKTGITVYHENCYSTQGQLPPKFLWGFESSQNIELWIIMSTFEFQHDFLFR